MTAFEFRSRLVDLSGFISHFAKRYAKNDDDARDLAQETFLRAITNYDKFRTDTNLKGWLRTIMRNTYINGYRRAASRVVMYNSDSHAVTVGEQEDYTPDSIYHKKQVEQAITTLADEFKIPFQRHFEGYKYQEIADELNLPIGTVKSRIFQARKLLSEQL